MSFIILVHLPVHLAPPLHSLPFELTIHSALAEPRSWFWDGLHQTIHENHWEPWDKENRMSDLPNQCDGIFLLKASVKPASKTCNLFLRKKAMLRVLTPSLKPVNNLSCKTDLMWVAKRATWGLNPFCSNVARKVSFFIVARFTLL